MNKILLYKDFLNEREQPIDMGYSLVMEGGAAGHMAHPFENKSLTFGDFRLFIEKGLSGELNFEIEPREKTDGQNLFATVMDGQVFFSRNKGELRAPMDIDAFITKWDDRPELVRMTFIEAGKQLSTTLPKLSAKDLEIFDNGKNWMNMELIYSKNPNVIHYDAGDVIQFHGIVITDGEGNIIGDNPESATSLANAIEKINAHVGEIFTIIPPQIVKIGKDLDFDKNKAKFIKKLEALRDRYGLTDADEVSRYHEMWWRDQIEEHFGNLTQDVKEGLLLRWAYKDKKTLDLRAISKLVDETQHAAIKKFDQEDVKKKYKENIRPFEDLFLELGSIIIKNASNFISANPDKEVQRLHKYLNKEVEKIRKGDNISNIEKVEAELARLDRIGGMQSILPTEGIVFRYKGKNYKLTGTFAAINQLLGIIKYGR